MMRGLAIAVLLGALLAAAAAAAGGFRLSSPAFAPGGTIPARYTCKGENRSPALRWTAPPPGTKSFALELEDPDAPVPGGFTHWLGWGVNASTRSWPAGRPLPIEGANGTGNTGYTGPCPPSGTHHYHFTLYALKAPLHLAAGGDRAAFRRALRSRVLARAMLVGTFGSGS